MIFDFFIFSYVSRGVLLEFQQQAIRFQSIWECQLRFIYVMIALPESSVPTRTHCGLRLREFPSLPTSDEMGGLRDDGYSSL